MSPYSLIPVLVGVVAVAQAVLNRRIGGQWGLASAVLINAVVFVACATLLYFAAGVLGDRAGVFRLPVGERGGFKWWWVLPGVFGFLLVCGLPWALTKLPATQVFVLLIATQIGTSLAWDRFIDGQSASPQRWIGAALAIAGALLVSLGR